MIFAINSSILVTVCILLVVLRDWLISQFTGEEEVKVIVTQVLLLLAFSHFFEGTQEFLQGPIRALGLQKAASFCAIFCHYAICLPMGWIFCFKSDLGVLGLEAGYGLANLIIAICFLLILWLNNWQKLADDAVKRVKAAKK